MEQVKDTLKEVAYAILPVTVVIIILQVTLIRLPLENLIQFLIGVAFVGSGFFLFLLGVHAGLLPVGEKIGRMLPKTNKPWLIIGTGFILGIAVTVAEPDVRVLANQIDRVSDDIGSGILIMSVSLGLAIFVALAMIRTLYNVPLSYLLVGGYVLVFALSFFVPPDFISISFDAGGVTTGPMAVPFILALGIGVASVLRKDTSGSSDGFGLIGLASIGPILAVMILGVLYQ